jgi:thiol-disulfide isomerase/thioredoxin
MFISKKNKFELVKPVVAISFGLVTLFITAIEMKVSYHEVSYTQGNKIKNTFLEIYGLNNQKETLTFIFSPNCVHCRNITQKVNTINKAQYNKIVGLYPKEISDKLVNEYQQEFNPTFQVVPVPYDSITKITKILPLFVILKNGKIEKIMKKI